MAGAREGPPTDAGTADAERLAQRRAEVEERGRIRRAIAQGLLRDLTELRAQAENLDPAKEASWTALRELREQLLSGLQSRKMLLEKSGSTED
jgi:hypothetical protein